MTKIEEFVKLITGRFDNKEQFDAMKRQERHTLMHST